MSIEAQLSSLDFPSKPRKNTQTISIPKSGTRHFCKFAPQSNDMQFGRIIDRFVQCPLAAVRLVIDDILMRNPWTLQISTNPIELSTKSIGYFTFLKMIEGCIEVVAGVQYHYGDIDDLIPIDQYSNFQNLVKALQHKYEFESSSLDLFCSNNYNRRDVIAFEIIKNLLIMLTHPNLIIELASMFKINEVIDPSHYELYHSFALKEVKLTDIAYNWFRCLVLDSLQNVLTKDAIRFIKQKIVQLSMENHPCAYCSEFHPLKFCHYAHEYKCKKCKRFMVVNSESDLLRNLHPGLDPKLYEDAELMCNWCNRCSICDKFISFASISCVKYGMTCCSACF
jgi:hypothetical protein